MAKLPKVAVIGTGGTITSLSSVGPLDLYEYTSTGKMLEADQLVDKFPEFHDDPVGLARIRGQQAVAQAAMGERRRAFRTIYETLRLSPRERRAPVALVVAAGVPAGWILKLLHRFGKGI